jgi:transposase
VNSVGIDLHRKRSHVAVIDEEGEQLLSRRIINDPQTFLTLLENVGASRIALEATYGWEWLADVLQDAGYELHLAHPMRTKAIASARVKTDAVDARTLAQLLRADLLPEAYIAPRELRDLRDLLRHRVALTRMRSSLKNRVSAVLAKNGIQRPYSDLFGPAGTRFLTDVELREGPRRRLDSTLALIGDFTREIDATSREIDARAHDDPYVPVLCQIRGVGRYIAMLVIAEVGDITRFASARRLCSWAGLTPTVRSSDGKARLGHISGQGSPPLRWALVEAAQHAAGGGGPLRDSYERIAKRRGKQIAKVAVARRILTLCFYGLRDGEIRCLAPRATARAVRTPASPHDPPRPPCAADPGAQRLLERSSAVVNGLDSPTAVNDGRPLD